VETRILEFVAEAHFGTVCVAYARWALVRKSADNRKKQNYNRRGNTIQAHKPRHKIQTGTITIGKDN
jgi:hypothetical protein